MYERTYYTPPQTWKDYLATSTRYKAAHGLLESEFPHLYPTVAAVTDFIERNRSSAEIDQIWRAGCAAQGINLERLQLVQAATDQIVRSMMPATMQELISNDGHWEPVPSTKLQLVQ